MEPMGTDCLRLHFQRPRIDAYLRPEAFLGDLGVDENLMSDQFWHTLREAPLSFFLGLWEEGKKGWREILGVSHPKPGRKGWSSGRFWEFQSLRVPDLGREKVSSCKALRLAGFAAGVWALVRVSVGCR